MATGVAQQYGCALDSAVERAQAERINAIARIRARSGRCANQGGRVGDRETNARQLMEIEERPGIREAWFPGRKRPVCSGERTVNGPASPQPISMTEPPSRGLPGDRPVVYSRGLGDPRFFRQPSSARMLWAREPARRCGRVRQTDCNPHCGKGRMAPTRRSPPVPNIRVSRYGGHPVRVAARSHRRPKAMSDGEAPLTRSSVDLLQPGALSGKETKECPSSFSARCEKRACTAAS